MCLLVLLRSSLACLCVRVCNCLQLIGHSLLARIVGHSMCEDFEAHACMFVPFRP